MAKGLLLGNGINSCIGIKDLSESDIRARYENTVKAYLPIIRNVFGVELKDDFWGFINNKIGIESLLGILYTYIKENSKTEWKNNDEYRLQDVITCIGITSIFYTKEGKINSDYNKAKLPLMVNYNYVFTLNYIEFWDKEEKCIHLHGKVNIHELPNLKDVILISKRGIHLREYARAVTCIKKTSNVIEFQPLDIILAPEGVEKNNLFAVKGVFLSDKLYPADDLFLYRGRELYNELSRVDELDVFGMSPYGDESILDIINSKNNVRVYVYRLNENEETIEWKKRLTCNYELLDSSEIGF